MNLSAESSEIISKKIKFFSVIFDFEMERREVPSFRAAVVKKVGEDNVLFHNHLDNKFRYSYPLIQYKVLRKNPTIVCVNEGSEEILKFFEKTDWSMAVGQREVQTRIKDIHFDYFYCGFSAKPIKYQIYNWFALNEANFEKYSHLDDDYARMKLLKRIIIGNILSFAKGIGWNVDREIEVMLTDLPKQRLFSFKNHRMMGFDLKILTNVILPDAIGLGKSVSRGFGTIRKVS